MFVTQSAIKMAPPFSLVSKFFISACFYLAIFSLVLPFSNPQTPPLAFSFASLVHLYLLGFVMMLIIGALYQLVPVVLEVSFFTLKFANVVFWLLFMGSGLFCIGMFLVNTPLMHSGGGLVYLALFYFSIVFLLSFTKIEKFTFVRFCLFCAGICLILGLSFGFYTLLGMLGSVELENLEFWILRHIIFTFGGFVFLIVLGVSLVLLPMFSLSHDFKNIYAKISLLFLFLALFESFFAQNLISYALFFALGFYIVQCLHILYLRARKQKDYWFLNIVFGLIYLFLSAGFLFYDVKIALMLATLGFLYHFIIGHLYKILPFLVWYKYISPQVGKKKIPMLNEMINEKAAYLQLILSGSGVLLLFVGTLILNPYISLIGAILITLSTFVILYNVYFAYKFKNF